MGKISLGVNMEFVRHDDKSFEWGVEKAAELGYEYVEPMVHLGRELLSEAGYFHRGQTGMSARPTSIFSRGGELNMLKRILEFLPIIALTAALLAVGGRSAPADDENITGLHLKQGPATVSIFDGGQPLLRYRYQGVDRKPYADQLFSPAGVQVLRDSPSDHKHHHGLMYAVSVAGVNFWEENKPEFGSEKHRSLEEVKHRLPDGLYRVGLTEELDWTAPARDKPLLVKRREVCAARAPNLGATLVDWRCRLAAPEGKDSTVLGGAVYNGLGMRFVQSMDKGRPTLQRRRQAGRARPRRRALHADEMVCLHR